jgi:hypothetical protein
MVFQSTEGNCKQYTNDKCNSNCLLDTKIYWKVSYFIGLFTSFARVNEYWVPKLYLSNRLDIHKELLPPFQIVRLLPPFQIVSRSDFSSCIAFTMYLDIMHIQVHSYVPRKAKNSLQYGAGGVVANINHEAC